MAGKGAKKATVKKSPVNGASVAPAAAVRTAQSAAKSVRVTDGKPASLDEDFYRGCGVEAVRPDGDTLCVGYYRAVDILMELGGDIIATPFPDGLRAKFCGLISEYQVIVLDMSLRIERLRGIIEGLGVGQVSRDTYVPTTECYSPDPGKCGNAVVRSCFGLRPGFMEKVWSGEIAAGGSVKSVVADRGDVPPPVASGPVGCFPSGVGSVAVGSDASVVPSRGDVPPPVASGPVVGCFPSGVISAVAERVESVVPARGDVPPPVASGPVGSFPSGAGWCVESKKSSKKKAKGSVSLSLGQTPGLKGPCETKIPDRPVKLVVLSVPSKISHAEFMTDLFELNPGHGLSRCEFDGSVRVVGPPWDSSKDGELSVVIEGPASALRPLLMKRRVFVKWFALRVREFDQVPSCYRCLSFDHFVRDCRRSAAACARCGQWGHMARDCANAISCRNCAFKGRASDHLMMSGDCPVYYGMLAKQLGTSA